MFTGVLNNEGEQLCECQVVLLICTQIHPVISVNVIDKQHNHWPHFIYAFLSISTLKC